jgi:hypothetical protein
MSAVVPAAAAILRRQMLGAAVRPPPGLEDVMPASPPPGLEGWWTAHSNETASVILLAAAIARDTPLIGSEGCAEGLGEEERTPTTAHGSASSSADSEMGDGAPVNTIDEEMSRPLEKNQNKQKRSRRFGMRPDKQQREDYRALVASLEDMMRQDPSLSLESFPFPQYVLNNDKLRARLVARVEALRPAVW